MAAKKPKAPASDATYRPDPAIRMLEPAKAAAARFPHLHIYHHGAVCDTDKMGHAMPEERSPLEIVVNATEGFIPLWDADVTLRWRFNAASMTAFRNPDAAKDYIRALFAGAVDLWGLPNVPVRFTEVRDAWDFEFKVSRQEDCTGNGCTLARAFFPDAGQHDIMLFPTLFAQPRGEQVETMAHEIGHVFGLRHFFAKLEEKKWRSEIFGTHDEESIMNYGENSRMTEADRADLRELYAAARSGRLKQINGTPIRLVRPFSTLRVPVPQAVAFREAVMV